MDLIDWVTGGIVLLAIVIMPVQWYRGFQHRRRSSQQGKETRYLWWHVRAAARELREADKQKRAAQKDAKANKESLSSTVAENRSAAKKAMQSKEWKKKAQKARKSEARKSPPSPAAQESSNNSLPIDGVETDVENVANSNSRGHLRFVYKDSQDNVTVRELSSWGDDGVYIEGFCHTAGDIRTFRRDRVVEFLGEKEFPGPTKKQSSSPSPIAAPALEILFTGFSANVREGLEADAEDAGMLVRKTVTKNLNFVCAGPKAGATKLSKARRQGCTILNKDQFQQMLATGEVPAGNDLSG